MRRHSRLSTVALATIFALVFSLAGGIAPAVLSQDDATPGTQGQHPIVGTWQWDNNPDSAEPFSGISYAIFHADGSYIEFFPPVGVGIGTWEATGANTVNLTIVFQDIDDDPHVVEPGTSRYRISIEVDATGNTLTATGDLETRDASGTVIVAAPFTGTATRVTVEAPGATGIPAATPAS
jgi:hypothetical protein